MATITVRYNPRSSAANILLNLISVTDGLSIVGQDVRRGNATDYVLSSPEMEHIVRQGMEDIAKGRGKVVKSEDLWK